MDFANALMVAGEGISQVDTVVTSMTSDFTSLANSVATGAAGVVGVGLIIFGLQFAVRKLKSFFNRVA